MTRHVVSATFIAGGSLFTATVETGAQIGVGLVDAWARAPIADDDRATGMLLSYCAVDAASGAVVQKWHVTPQAGEAGRDERLAMGSNPNG